MSTLKSLEAAIERIILNPRYHDPLMLVKAIRNGVVYGTKVRFPHALVSVSYYALPCTPI
jgi:hypothetical protein